MNCVRYRKNALLLLETSRPGYFRDARSQKFPPLHANEHSGFFTKNTFSFLPPLLLHLNEMRWQKKVCNQSQNWVTDSFLLTAASLLSEKIFLLKYPGVSGVIFCMTLLYLVSNSISRSFEHDFVFMQIAEVRGNISIDDFLRFVNEVRFSIFFSQSTNVEI